MHIDQLRKLRDDRSRMSTLLEFAAWADGMSKLANEAAKHRDAPPVGKKYHEGCANVWLAAAEAARHAHQNAVSMSRAAAAEFSLHEDDVCIRVTMSFGGKTLVTEVAIIDGSVKESSDGERDAIDKIEVSSTFMDEVFRPYMLDVAMKRRAAAIERG